MMQLYPKPRKKSVMPTDYRAKILSSAIKIFAQKGYAKCTMSDVAIHAKVGIGTLYNYFKNKDEMLQLCIQKTIEDEIQQIRKESDKIADPVEQLRYFFNQHLELLNDKPYVARLLLVELRQSEGFYKRNPTYNPQNYYLDYIRDVCTKAIKSHRIRKVDPDAFAYLIIGTFDLVCLQWLIHGKAMSIDPILANVYDILADGVRKK
jgi:AcrR family transcriptional regulator